MTSSDRFETLYRAHEATVRRCVVSLGLPPHLGPDLLQDVWLTALRRLDEGGRVSTFTSPITPRRSDLRSAADPWRCSPLSERVARGSSLKGEEMGAQGHAREAVVISASSCAHARTGRDRPVATLTTTDPVQPGG